jgi:hypothetical protein
MKKIMLFSGLMMGLCIIDTTAMEKQIPIFEEAGFEKTIGDNIAKATLHLMLAEDPANPIKTKADLEKMELMLDQITDLDEDLGTKLLNALGQRLMRKLELELDVRYQRDPAKKALLEAQLESKLQELALEEPLLYAVMTSIGLKGNDAIKNKMLHVVAVPGFTLTEDALATLELIVNEINVLDEITWIQVRERLASEMKPIETLMRDLLRMKAEEALSEEDYTMTGDAEVLGKLENKIKRIRNLLAIAEAKSHHGIELLQ